MLGKHIGERQQEVRVQNDTFLFPEAGKPCAGCCRFSSCLDDEAAWSVRLDLHPLLPARIALGFIPMVPMVPMVLLFPFDCFDLALNTTIGTPAAGLLLAGSPMEPLGLSLIFANEPGLGLFFFISASLVGNKVEVLV